MVGKTISHYKVVAELGRGGMGVVYKAQDIRLDRTVALKFLSTSALPTDDDRARFYREAKAAAKLNHPHIAHVYEIDETEPAPEQSGNGQAFIVMEYVEGETLAEKIKRGPLKLEESITIACQVAEGLQVAHAAGIVHRDVKSSNVMLAPDGRAKVLDFGLAKTAASTKLTHLGSTVGTIAYMSPEQARGEEVDHRSDIWSLGVVLYEMISGRLPFPGDYEQAVVYSILNEEPEPLTGLRTGVPMDLERVVSKCMAKDQDRRYRHVDEVVVDLKAIDLGSRGGSPVIRAVVTPQQVRWKQVLPWGVVALMTVIALLLSWYLIQLVASPSLERWNLLLPEEAPVALVGTSVAGIGTPALAFSPDGTQLIYVAQRTDETTQLYRRAIDQLEATPIAGTEGAYFPFFSPDGSSVGFFAGGKLKTVSLQGGAPFTVCEVSMPWGATWMPDDRIVFADQDGSMLSWVSTSGGDVRVLDGTGNTTKIWWPSSLPGTDDVLVSTFVDLALISLPTGRMKRIPVPGVPIGISNPIYVPTGHVVFGAPGRLMAVPFDLDRREVTGQPVTVVNHVRTEISYGAIQFTVSGDGKLAYVPGQNAAVGNLVWVDKQGQEQSLGFEPAHYGPLELGPDGRRLGVSVLDNNWDVWIYDLDRASPERLTGPGEGNNNYSIWTPDSDRVVFRSDRGGQMGMYWTPTDGAGEAERLSTSSNYQFPSSWSPEGRLAYSEVNDSTAEDIWLLSVEDDHAEELLMGATNMEVFPKFSPDGRYLAYMSNENGPNEVYVQPYPEGKPRKRVSVGGGSEPVWSPSGDELFYRHNNGRQWMVVPVETQPELHPGEPRVFAEGPYLDVLGTGHDVGPDGRLLLIKGSGVRTASHLDIVTNWFEELKRLVPTDE